MFKKRIVAKAMGGALAVVALAAIVFVPSAAAGPTGEYARFSNCPYTNPAVFKCLYSKTTGGKVILGNKTVPIVNPAILQGGYSEESEEAPAKFYGATNGVTLSKAPQPVPGGLAGLVNCKEITIGWLRSACEAVFENGVTGVNSTLELARPASEIQISQNNLLGRQKTALRLPVKVHLENPFLGSECYVGSSSSPLIWNLTTGVTAPPAPNKPIEGATGKIHFIEEGAILELAGNKLVDNAWSAPGASGCGGFLVEYVLDPILNLAVGVPAAAGKNTAILENQIFISEAETVATH
jgi:hypothetical protein